MQAVADFRRKYGGPITAYVVLGVAVWLLGIIVLPQALMVEYSMWRLDRSESAQINTQIETLYKDKQRAEREVRKFKSDAAKPGADVAALDAQRTATETRLTDMTAQITELETKEVQPQKIYGFDNYVHFLTSDLHRLIFLKTVWASALVTIVSLLICYPVAFYLAHVASGDRTALLMLMLIVPYWVNELLRTLAWLMILSSNGILNVALMKLGLIHDPIDWREGNTGVIVGMTYAYVLFMVFPIYNTMETLEHQQIEAARDLGSPWWRIHWRIVIPHAKPGIAVGCIMVFMLAAGSFAVPQLLGGLNSLWFTQVIYSWFFDGSNWNMGSAYAMSLLILCIAFVMLAMRAFRIRLEDIARG
jgi:spermidine/putrescine transport system permease protein